MSLGVPGKTLPPIPGVEFHTIEEWNTTPYALRSGNPFPHPGDIIVVYIHYPGGGTAPTTKAGMDARMRSMQIAYAKPKSQGGRGYSLGYGFVVPPFGGVWEGRGVRFRNAANAGRQVPGNANSWSVSIQCAVTAQAAATDKQIRDAAAIIGWLRDLGMQVLIGTHQDVDSTSCAGTGIIPQVRAGLFEPDRWGYPFTPAPPQPDPGLPLPPGAIVERNFVITFTDGSGAFLWGPDTDYRPAHLDAFLKSAAIAAGAQEHRSDNSDLGATFRRLGRGE